MVSYCECFPEKGTIRSKKCVTKRTQDEGIQKVREEEEGVVRAVTRSRM